MSMNWMALIEKAQSIVPTKAHVDLLIEGLRKVGEERDDAVRRCAELEARLLRLEIPAGMVEHMGVLWKRTANGFEPNPYCKECPTHPVMCVFPPALVGEPPERWDCSHKHRTPYSKPPAA
jgi:hypothetical protein